MTTEILFILGFGALFVLAIGVALLAVLAHQLHKLRVVYAQLVKHEAERKAQDPDGVIARFERDLRQKESVVAIAKLALEAITGWHTDTMKVAEEKLAEVPEAHVFDVERLRGLGISPQRWSAFLRWEAQLLSPPPPFDLHATFPSKIGVAVGVGREVTLADDTPEISLMVDGIVLSPNNVRALREFFEAGTNSAARELALAIMGVEPEEWQKFIDSKSDVGDPDHPSR